MTDARVVLAGRAVTLSAGMILLVAAPVAATDIERQCAPVAARFQDSWQTVDASSGQTARRFGTLRWTRSGVHYDIRKGFAVEICTASADTEAGITYVEAGAHIRGPEAGRLPFEGLTGIGFGYVTVPQAWPTEKLPATGATALGGLLATALTALAVGAALTWRAARHRSRHAGPAAPQGGSR